MTRVSVGRRDKIHEALRLQVHETLHRHHRKSQDRHSHVNYFRFNELKYRIELAFDESRTAAGLMQYLKMVGIEPVVVKDAVGQSWSGKVAPTKEQRQDKQREGQADQIDVPIACRHSPNIIPTTGRTPSWTGSRTVTTPLTARARRKRMTRLATVRHS